MAGGLAITGVAIGASLNSGQVPKHAVLTADTSPVSAVNLDNCPTLAEGYHGGCVDQLQAELKGIEDLSLSVDGTFGPATYSAVAAFQQRNGLQPDGVVGPATKQALDNAESSVPTPTPGAPLPAQAPAPAVQPPTASVSDTPVFVAGYATNTIYFNQAQTDYFDSGESQACELFATLTPIPAVGEIGDVLAGGCEVQWKIVELQARRAEERGMCLKIKFTPPPAFVWWPDIYSGTYCD
jgi:peptidoglycan hydrolase-like protein with peptidoglycan-binding domain